MTPGLGRAPRKLLCPALPTPSAASRTLTTSGSACIDKFNALIKVQYGNDTACSTLVRSALSTSDTSKCPQGSQGSGSQVQKCMSKAPVSSRHHSFPHSSMVLRACLGSAAAMKGCAHQHHRMVNMPSGRMLASGCLGGVCAQLRGHERCQRECDVTPVGACRGPASASAFLWFE